MAKSGLGVRHESKMNTWEKALIATIMSLSVFAIVIYKLTLPDESFILLVIASIPYFVLWPVLLAVSPEPVLQEKLISP